MPAGPSPAVAADPSGAAHDAARALAAVTGVERPDVVLVLRPGWPVAADAPASPEVRGLLKQEYPADQATGFALGQFRGVFWAEVAPPAK